MRKVSVHVAFVVFPVVSKVSEHTRGSTAGLVEVNASFVNVYCCIAISIEVTNADSETRGCLIESGYSSNGGRQSSHGVIIAAFLAAVGGIKSQSQFDVLLGGATRLESASVGLVITQMTPAHIFQQAVDVPVDVLAELVFIICVDGNGGDQTRGNRHKGFGAASRNNHCVAQKEER